MRRQLNQAAPVHVPRIKTLPEIENKFYTLTSDSSRFKRSKLMMQPIHAAKFWR
jgi:hypothetical protein